MAKGFCQVDECLSPAARNGLCWGHAAQLQRKGAVGAKAPPRPQGALEVLREAAIAYADADTAEQVDGDLRRAEDNLRQAAKRYAKRSVPEAIKRGLAAAKARGVHVGRPRKLEVQQVLELVRLRGVTGAARELRVTRQGVQSVMRKARANKA